MVISATVLAIIGILVSLAIGVPSVFYARRQARIAETAHRAAIANSLHEQEIDVLARIRTEKQARIGIVHYPPFTSSIGDERESGLYVDLIRALCEAEGIVPLFIPMRFSGAVAAVRNDQVDMILSIFQTPRRRSWLIFAHLCTLSRCLVLYVAPKIGYSPSLICFIFRSNSLSVERRSAMNA